ncbi:uncharacterized protein LOC105685334 [Athalia rosae]|uniref:uncharacterized protein LOC105685334 n=1 Tax=Athalia rosae TaxID=37344 RepID=UPI0020336102|nr:uncharacterized protein LOC105685334 [Athalia rosae]XP_048507499.1 uncharacterized protein LOC105685334 [Athalia rosae]XP_048507500.1 uncharacterized protein LOC105685334 [Athalia rosae]
MFKAFPDIVVTCRTEPIGYYSINWEEIARWALEHGEPENIQGACMSEDNAAANYGQPIDWCSIADSFMREEALEDAADNCDVDDLNASIREHEQPILCPDETNNCGAAGSYGGLPSPIQHIRSTRTPAALRQRLPMSVDYDYMDNSELNRSMRESDFNNTSCYGRTPPSSIQDFSCMEGEHMHDSTGDYQSDILSYLEGRAERNRPHSIAEGYHFAGSAYGRADNSDDRRVYTSTPKKKQRTTRAETFEMVDGSKMFNVTFDECLSFGRKLRHISDVRAANGCQIMHLDREINEKPDGTRHRVDIARRWLDLDEDEPGCS